MAIFTGIAAAVTAVSGWIGGLGAFGAFALKTAVGVGLNLAAQALAGKPKGASQKFSINTGLSGGGALSRSFIMGRAATGGSLVWANTWGKEKGAPNAWLTQVIALSDIPVRGLAEVWVDGVKVTYNPANNNATVNGQSIPEFESGGPNLYIKFYDGNQTAADPQMILQDSTADRPWNGNRVGRGMAYAIIRARSSKGVFSGVPKITFVVDGVRLYDPSRDSSVGGTGTHRYDDPATWGGDGDDFPAVQIYNLMRGMRWNGKWIYGFQNMSGARLPANNWIAQINKCRKPIIESGGPQPTYRAGGEVEVNAPLSSALDEFLTSCQGKIAEAGGIYTLYVGEPDEPLFDITDGDILSTEEQDFTPFYGLAESINGIAATYPEPLDGYLERTAPPMFRPDLEALDGNRRLLADVQFSFVPYSEQVQRLMKSSLLAALRGRRHTISLPPKFWRFAVPGETLRWTSVRNGYVNKLFVIDGVADKDNLDVTIDITEYDPEDYAWTSSAEYKPPVIGSLGPIVPAARPIIDPYAEPFELSDSTGLARRAAIRLTWDASQEALIGIVGVQWQGRVQGTTEWVINGNTSFPERGSVIISSGVVPDLIYEMRLKYNAAEGEKEPLWSGLFTVRAPNVKLTGTDFEANLGSIAEDAKSVWKAIAQELDDVWKRIEHLGQSSQLDGAVGEIDRREIKVSVGKANASIVEEREVRATETAALARRATTIEASVSTNTARIQEEQLARVDGDAALTLQVNAANSNIGANTARILTEEQTRATADDALASQVTAVRAEIATGFADGMIKFEAVAAPSGVTVRYSLLMRATTAEQFRQTGFFMEIYNSGGGVLKARTVFDTDQFVILSTGNATASPFVFEDGVLKLALAHIKRITSGEIEIGKTLINSNGITVSS